LSAVPKTAALKIETIVTGHLVLVCSCDCVQMFPSVTTTIVHITIMIGAEVVGFLISRRVKLLPRRAPGEFLARFKQLQHVRVPHTVNPDVAHNK